MTGLKKLAVAVATCAVLATAVQAQQSPDPRPVPRNAEGRVSFAGTKEFVGNWEGLLGTMTNTNGVNPANIPEALSYDQVPFQPWAAELHATRREGGGKDDPHTRCKPSGGARMFHTPYGLEVLDIGDQVIFVNIGAPHSWRHVYLDGRAHPADFKPSWYGHSTGHWEADTLVVDTVGFNDKFWFSRDGFPHTQQLHLIEKFSRPSFDKLRYEITVDDPGAYTAPWTGGWFLNWADGNEPFDYLCQENNLDPDRMIGTE